MSASFDRIELLKHLVRVNNGEQCLFNRFYVGTDEIRRYNMKCHLIQFDIEKLQIMYELSDQVRRTDIPNEKLLYKVNEGLKILFNKSYGGKNFLYPHVVLIAVLELLIHICELIDNIQVKNAYVSLVHSIDHLICSQFLAEYVDGLMQHMKEDSKTVSEVF